MSETDMGDLDLYLIGEGRHHRLWEALGAHVFPGGAASRSGLRTPARSGWRRLQRLGPEPHADDPAAGVGGLGAVVPGARPVSATST